MFTSTVNYINEYIIIFSTNISKDDWDTLKRIFFQKRDLQCLVDLFWKINYVFNSCLMLLF